MIVILFNIKDKLIFNFCGKIIFWHNTLNQLRELLNSIYELNEEFNFYY